jgi:alanyl-tRNA synthetase
VEPERLRFDFAHTKPVSEAELERVESLANAVVAQNEEISTRLMTVEDAIKEGAMALFGEKYGDEVRVVAMGAQPEGGPNKPVYSLELCGGTHVRRTGDVGLIKIVSQGASAAGVRRIEAVAGETARRYLTQQERRLQNAADLLKVVPADVPHRIETLLDERRRLEREIAEARKQLAMGAKGREGDDAVEVAGVKFMGRVVKDVDPKDLKSLADEGKKTVGSGVVAFATVSADGKGAIVVGVTDDLTPKFNAIELVRAGSSALGGKGGGGRPDMAQAGGPNGSKAQEALDAVRNAMSG